MKLTNKGGNAYVMGWPVDHSLSPLIHNYWMKLHHIEAEYGQLPVEPEALESAIHDLPKKQAIGVNLTVPHKELVLPFLDRIDPHAEKIGAVNTVVVEEGGKLSGYNTDAYGFWQSIRGAVDVVSDRAVLVIGAGGAARAVANALHEHGAASIMIANRSFERAEKLAGDIGKTARALHWEEIPSALMRAALMVNTTMLGMKGQPPLEIDLDPLSADAVVCDIVYVPLETELLKRARERGLQTVDGLGMLLYQAQKSFELWYDILPEVDANIRAMLENEVKKR